MAKNQFGCPEPQRPSVSDSDPDEQTGNFGADLGQIRAKNWHSNDG